MTLTHYFGAKGGETIVAKEADEKAYFDAMPEDYVCIKLTHCGFCGTDAHAVQSKTALGHEPIGKVHKLGSRVSGLQVGQRVGYGYTHRTCGHCMACLQGQDTRCPSKASYITHDNDAGGFSTYFNIRNDFVIPIPDALDSAEAAPLMCAGLTVFRPFVDRHISAIHTVGVIGIGGLGHLALQFSRAFGCKTIAFTSSESKVKEAKSFGADEVIFDKQEQPSEDVKVDFLINSASSKMDLTPYIPYFKRGGQLIPLTVDFGKLELPNNDFMQNELTASPSLVGNRYHIRMMLEFAARHNIKPKIEKMPLNADNLTTALHRLNKNDVKYRFVLEHPQ